MKVITPAIRAYPKNPFVLFRFNELGGYSDRLLLPPCPQAHERSAPPLALLGMDTGCRFLSCLRIRAAAGRHHFRVGRRGAELGQADAPCAQDQGRWCRSGIKVGVGAAASSRSLWSGQALRYSLSLPQTTLSVDALSPL